MSAEEDALALVSLHISAEQKWVALHSHNSNLGRQATGSCHSEVIFKHKPLSGCDIDNCASQDPLDLVPSVCPQCRDVRRLSASRWN
jgi:hypothetical protein